MAEKLLFLSHIHEERDLAVLIKQKIETEFGGFVSVFVSSDGESIPSGINFLRRIEIGLVNCIGAIYLISPKSLKRPWISFELGAVWIRNLIQTSSGGSEIPAIPFCHSGISPGQLPTPIGQLNAIQASDRFHLEAAFRSLQLACGGKGELKTDFAELAANISQLERTYTVGQNFAKLVNLLPVKDIEKLIIWCKENPNEKLLDVNAGFTTTEKIQVIQGLQSNQLKGLIEATFDKPSLGVTPDRVFSHGAEATIRINPAMVTEFAEEIRAGAGQAS